MMLNSNVPIGKTSAQYAFVQRTMQQTPTRCTMAVLHHPFDSSGVNGPTPSLRDVWELMYNLGGDVVIAGHDHLYERHAPVNTDQRRDDAKGIRQFTVGTGGAPLYNRVRAGAQLRDPDFELGRAAPQARPRALRVAVHGHERQRSGSWPERLPLDDLGSRIERISDLQSAIDN